MTPAEKAYKSASKDLHIAQKKLTAHQIQIAKLQTSAMARGTKVQVMTKQGEKDPQSQMALGPRLGQEIGQYMDIMDRLTKLYLETPKLLNRMKKAEDALKKAQKQMKRR